MFARLMVQKMVNTIAFEEAVEYVPTTGRYLSLRRHHLTELVSKNETWACNDLYYLLAKVHGADLDSIVWSFLGLIG